MKVKMTGIAEHRGVCGWNERGTGNRDSVRVRVRSSEFKGGRFGD